MARAKWMPPHCKRKWILVTDEVVYELKKLKWKNESYDSVIRRLLKYYKAARPQGY